MMVLMCTYNTYAESHLNRFCIRFLWHDLNLTQMYLLIGEKLKPMLSYFIYINQPTCSMWMIIKINKNEVHITAWSHVIKFLSKWCNNRQNKKKNEKIFFFGTIVVIFIFHIFIRNIGYIEYCDQWFNSYVYPQLLLLLLLP